MKHDDEVAKVSALQLAMRKRYALDIDSLIVQYEDAQSRLKNCDSEIEILRRDIAASRKLRNEYGAAAQTSAAEVVKLSRTLAAIRGSRSYRLGRTISRPLQIVRMLARTASGPKPNGFRKIETRHNQRLLDRIEVDYKTNPRHLPKTNPSAVPLATSSASVESRYVAVAKQFMDAPSRANAIKVIYFDYFTCGSLKRPAEFIEKHAGLLAGISPKEQRVLGHIQGQAVLLETAPTLPPRQPNIGYLAERGRIMYCAHSSGHYNSNGYSTRTTGVALGLHTAGEDVVVVARPGYPWDSKIDVTTPTRHRFEQQISGLTHIFNPGPSWTSDRLDQYLAESTDIFVREAQRNRVSLVHSASNYVTALPALIAARRMGVPFVYEVRGLWEITELSTKANWGDSDRFKLAKKLETMVASNADRVLAITDEVRSELIDRGVDPSKVSLLPNSVDTNIFTPMPAAPGLRERLGIQADATIVGYAGSLVEYEGVADMIGSVGTLRNGHRNVVLVVVGDGPEMQNLKDQTRKLLLTESVVFVGRVSTAEIPAYISIFDVMACPRLKLPVTQMVSPLKPLEAMACGKALILSDLAPMRGLAGSKGERALLTIPGDGDSLSSAIISLIDDDTLRQSIARRARLWTVRERTWVQAGAVAMGVHRDATEDYLSVQSGTPLENLTIAIISDQFTLEGLKPESNFVVLRPDSWKEQLSIQAVDALFVESAWEGVDGLWHHKIGFYDEELFGDLRKIIDWCNQNGVPTLFWNKEDPVHFSRFLRTSKYFDHVFTSDASRITSYMSSAGAPQRTVSSLPFYAQPKLHNILPSSRGYEHTVNYAGTYYGDRFAIRSAELGQLLKAASGYGLSIYDRQYLDTRSPYQFPEDLSRYVRGGLDYLEMVDAYKAHPVHINVNSVADSPTMFSRRVMEIAASGGVVVSGKGRGIEEIFAGLIPVVDNQGDAELLIEQWMHDEESRLRDAWLSYRLVHRMHTAGHRLTYALRTAGLKVQAPVPHKYSVFVQTLTEEIAAELGRQTVLPTEIYSVEESEVSSPLPPRKKVNSREDALSIARNGGISWLGELGSEPIDRTYFEDLLSTLSFGAWGIISTTSNDLGVPGLGLAQSIDVGVRQTKLIATDRSSDESLVLRRPTNSSSLGDALVPVGGPMNSRRVLIAGHDLKFAASIVRQLEAEGHRVTFDEWNGHSGHDEAQSRSLLEDADVIFCEWTLGNVAWYSNNKSVNQRLVSRLHLQELSTDYLKYINYENVDSMIFVGQHVADIAIRDHGVPASIATVIPNYVDVRSLAQEKIGNVRFNLGLVGIIPERKRLDIALDALRSLRMNDERFQLYIKGKLPQEYPWMSSRPNEARYYREQFLRINSDPLLRDAVHFDGYDGDMPEWYKKIGIALSVSDYESFHLTLADGAASGAVPVSLAWPGADQIYPVSWLSADVAALVRDIQTTTVSYETWVTRSRNAKEYSVRRFDENIILNTIVREITGQ